MSKARRRGGRKRGGRRRGGRGWTPPSGGSSRRSRGRGRGVGDEGSANEATEEAASVDADSLQLLSEQISPLPESVMARSGGRFSLSADVSGIWDAVCRLMGWSDEEPDEEAQLVDPRVPRISERMDEIFDAALEEKDLGRVILLRRAYDLLGTFLQGIQSATT